MEGFGLRSIGGVLRGMACLLCVCFLVALAMEGVNQTKKQGLMVTSSSPLSSSSSSLSSSSSSAMASDNSVGPTLKGRPLLGLQDLNPLRDMKRKVPNGADPIHNRSAGKSGRPPGRQ